MKRILSWPILVATLLAASGAGPARAVARNIAGYQLGQDLHSSVLLDMAFDQSLHRAYVVRGYSAAGSTVLAAVDMATETMTDPISINSAFRPLVAVDETRDLYVIADSRFEVRSRLTLELKRTYWLPNNTSSFVAVDPTTHLIYISAFWDQMVVVIDPATGDTTTLPMATNPGFVTVAPSQHRLYLLADESLKIFDTRTLAPVDELAGIDGEVFVDETEGRLYLTDHRVLPGKGYTYGLQIADLVTGAEITWIETPNGFGPMAVDRERHILYYWLYEIDTESYAVSPTLFYSQNGEAFTLNPADYALDASSHLLLATNEYHNRLDLVANDRVVPTSHVDPPPANLLLRALTGGTISGVSTDDVAGVDTVEVIVSSSSGDSTTYEPVLTCSANRGSCTWQVPVVGLPGSYTIEARATDRVGNEETQTQRVSFLAI